MNETELCFSALNAQSADPGCIDTFAYWLGVLSDPSTHAARDADEACAVMSHQMECEEQAIDLNGLCGYPEIIPDIVCPVAPVTLALGWSPFPAAITALGSPLYLHLGDYGKVLAVFRPTEMPCFDAISADERHFLMLLRECSARAIRSKRWVFLTGSPGWSYASYDLLAESPDLQHLMAEFGFVVSRRKP